MVIASYLEDAEAHLPPMSIRLTCSNLVSLDEIREAGGKVREVCQEVFAELARHYQVNTNGSDDDDYDEQEGDSEEEEEEME